MGIDGENTSPANATSKPWSQLVPDPKAPLRAQVHEVARFKHLSDRTEATYWWLGGAVSEVPRT